MALTTISQKILDAVYSRLSNATTGFNPSFASQAVQYSISPTFVQIDWSAQSQNFFFAQLGPDMLEQSSIFRYPLAFMYIGESAQIGTQKFAKYSANVRCVFELYLSWKNMKALQNYEKYTNCVEDVVVDVINRESNQNWGKPLVYNGNIQCKRAPVVFGAENFRQRMGFAMLFEIHQ